MTIKLINTFVARFRRSTHVTPKSYLSFISGYKNIYSTKFGEINELSNRMTTGLDKLVEASLSVAELSKELAVKEKELAVASKEAEVVWKLNTMLGRFRIGGYSYGYDCC